MARGDAAKKQVEKVLTEAFGQNYIGCYDKKYYVYADENGEKIQIAITLTCPKNPVEANTTSRISGKINFEEDAVIAPATFTPAEITQAEQDNIAALMQRLGL